MRDGQTLPTDPHVCLMQTSQKKLGSFRKTDSQPALTPWDVDCYPSHLTLSTAASPQQVLSSLGAWSSPTLQAVAQPASEIHTCITTEALVRH